MYVDDPEYELVDHWEVEQDAKEHDENLRKTVILVTWGMMQMSFRRMKTS